MTPKHAIVGLLTVGMLVTTAPAHSAASAYTYGVVNKSCGMWTANPLHVSDTNGSQVTWEGSSEGLIMQGSMLGYVSGVAVGLAVAGGQELRHTDVGAMQAWMTQYCAAHPLDRIATAADALVHELVMTQ